MEDSRFELLQINLESTESVEQLTLPVLSSPDFGVAYTTLLKAIESLEEIKSNVDNKVKELMKEEYLKSGESKVEQSEFSMTYMPGSYRTSFDGARLKEDNPELYASYCSTSVVRPSLRITKKRGKKV